MAQPPLFPDSGRMTPLSAVNAVWASMRMIQYCSRFRTLRTCINVLCPLLVLTVLVATFCVIGLYAVLFIPVALVAAVTASSLCGTMIVWHSASSNNEIKNELRKELALFVMSE